MRLARALGAIALLIAGASPAYAQTDSCRLAEPSERLQWNPDEAGGRIVHVIAPVVICDGGARITAEEGTLYEARNEVHLIGNVQFRDPDRALTSDQAIYTTSNGRLYATGNVVFTDNVEGMTIRGPELEYFRATPQRPQSSAIATQRPHLTLLPASRDGQDETDASDEPILIDADRMTMTGNDHFVAIGRVEIRRSDFQAFSNEARMDQVQERMELVGQSRVHSEQFDLSGDRIDMAMPGDRLERILARNRASLVGEDLRVDAPEIQLFLADDELQRMVARTDEPGDEDRPVATARGFRLEADSLDALTPRQQLERVIAIGNARGEAIDTLGIPPGRILEPAPAGDLAAAEHDWIVGDTVTGFFVGQTVAAEHESEPDPGTEEKPEVRLDRVLAVGNARALYRVQSNRPEANGRPGINYVMGEAIELTFDQGEMQVADVRGLERGIYLDPETMPAPSTDDEPDDEAEVEADLSPPGTAVAREQQDQGRR